MPTQTVPRLKLMLNGSQVPVHLCPAKYTIKLHPHSDSSSVAPVHLSQLVEVDVEEQPSVHIHGVDGRH